MPITEAELRLIAAAAVIGLSRIPKMGYGMPAAMRPAHCKRRQKTDSA
jgi:hypothetical protein